MMMTVIWPGSEKILGASFGTCAASATQPMSFCIVQAAIAFPPTCGHQAHTQHEHIAKFARSIWRSFNWRPEKKGDTMGRFPRNVPNVVLDWMPIVVATRPMTNFALSLPSARGDETPSPPRARSGRPGHKQQARGSYWHRRPSETLSRLGLLTLRRSSAEMSGCYGRRNLEEDERKIVRRHPHDLAQFQPTERALPDEVVYVPNAPARVPPFKVGVEGSVRRSHMSAQHEGPIEEEDPVRPQETVCAGKQSECRLPWRNVDHVQGDHRIKRRRFLHTPYSFADID